MFIFPVIRTFSCNYPNSAAFKRSRFTVDEVVFLSDGVPYCLVDQHGWCDSEERAIAIASFSDRFGTGAAGAAGASVAELQPIARPATNRVNIMAIVRICIGAFYTIS